MLQTIKGIYNNGRLTLEEMPEISEPAEVLVTFTGNTVSEHPKKKLVFGFAKGGVQYMSADFNEPLDDLKDYM